ncbi:SAP DNA-binding domain-containing protein [Reticulomyxa filosa]|uniref:SAP DNA-binding domain-containing protein n=1 Tax=Reticulomyxa filosa TaxID=46433 RepID=X6M3W2_RETFI|nr:SAP DNA-binding domain-containing protein [Reticulomyxa filosa]|eukprot:ETO08668.1 SAP DNA-binding domain-containing protein [Reticulomyxa filosa]
MDTLELYRLLGDIQCQSHVTYDCRRIITDRQVLSAKSITIDDDDNHENVNLANANHNNNNNNNNNNNDYNDDDEMEIDLDLRIQGRDCPLRQRSGTSLQTILLQIMQVTHCPHDNFLYVDCHKAVLKHLTQIQLCKTFFIAKKGLVGHNELDQILQMT